MVDPDRIAGCRFGGHDWRCYAGWCKFVAAECCRQRVVILVAGKSVRYRAAYSGSVDLAHLAGGMD